MRSGRTGTGKRIFTALSTWQGLANPRLGLLSAKTTAWISKEKRLSTPTTRSLGYQHHGSVELFSEASFQSKLGRSEPTMAFSSNGGYHPCVYHQTAKENFNAGHFHANSFLARASLGMKHESIVAYLQGSFPPFQHEELRYSAILKRSYINLFFYLLRPF